MTSALVDAHAVSADPAMPFIALALDAGYMQARLSEVLGERTRICAIRVTRWKPARRCLIEYDVSLGRTPSSLLTWIGKVRARSFDEVTYTLTSRLGAALTAAADSPVAVPATRGAVPECHMWLQDKVAGESGWSATSGLGGPDAARRIGGALARLQRALPLHSRTHSMADELAILGAGLNHVRLAHPVLARRVDAVQRACERAAATVSKAPALGIHRDFYHDQVLVDARRVWMLDLDLSAQGDPALDVGNFVAHLTEQSLRLHGDGAARAAAETAFVEGFHAEGGAATAHAIGMFKTLSLARLVYISTILEARRSFTPALLKLCEQRLHL